MLLENYDPCLKLSQLYLLQAKHVRCENRLQYLQRPLEPEASSDERQNLIKDVVRDYRIIRCALFNVDEESRGRLVECIFRVECTDQNIRVDQNGRVASP